DPLELDLVDRLRHELLDDRELPLLLRRLFLAAPAAERLSRLQAALAFPLEHVQLLVLLQRALHLFLGRAKRGQGQPQHVRPFLVAGAHRRLELLLDPLNQAHSNALPPPSTCQWRWNTVCPAPGPTLTITW